MSEVGARRFPMIAMGFAVVAFVVSVVAAVVVVNREHGGAAAGAAIDERTVKASDVVKLSRDTVEITPNGARVKDTALATALGVSKDDVITAISGRAIKRDFDFHDIVFNTSLMRATTLYVELEHDQQSVLVRWRLEGDLREARRATYDWPSRSAALGSLSGPTGGVLGGSIGSMPPPPPPPPTNLLTAPDPPPAADPDDDLTKDIVKIDDTYYVVPQSSVDKFYANPMAAAKGARVVPAVKNGQMDGFKLYAIRPSSVYAKVGFQNGDTIHSVNGYSLGSADDALKAFTKLKDAKLLEFEITRRGKDVLLMISIK